MSSAISAFNWRTGQPSAFAADAAFTNKAKAPKSPSPGLTIGSGAGGQIKPERQPPAVYKQNGLVAPDNNGFSIPSRVQAQADSDRRHALRKGGI